MENLVGKFFKLNHDDSSAISYYKILGKTDRDYNIVELYSYSEEDAFEINKVRWPFEYIEESEEITSDQFYAAYANLMFEMNNIVMPDND